MFIVNFILYGFVVCLINSGDRRIVYLIFVVLVVILVIYVVNEIVIGFLKDNYIKFLILRNLIFELKLIKFKEKINFFLKVLIKFSF